MKKNLKNETDAFQVPFPTPNKCTQINILFFRKWSPSGEWASVDKMYVTHDLYETAEKSLYQQSVTLQAAANKLTRCPLFPSATLDSFLEVRDK